MENNATFKYSSLDNKYKAWIINESSTSICYDDCQLTDMQRRNASWCIEKLRKIGLTDQIIYSTLHASFKININNVYSVQYFKLFIIVCSRIYTKLFLEDYNFQHLIDLFNSDEDINMDYNIPLVNETEIFILNKIDWEINITTLPELRCYLLDKFTKNFYSNIKSKSNQLIVESLKKNLNFFEELAYSLLNINCVSLTHLCISIILISFDQLDLTFISSEEIKFINCFLDYLVIKYNIDLLRVEYYKQIYIDSISNINLKLEIKLEIPDKSIRNYLKSRKNKPFKITSSYPIFKNHLNSPINNYISIKSFSETVISELNINIANRTCKSFEEKPYFERIVISSKNHHTKLVKKEYVD